MGPVASPDIWILDVARRTSSPLTFDPASDDYPAWSPEGKNIVFSSNRAGKDDLYMKSADGSGGEQSVFKVTSDPRRMFVVPTLTLAAGWDLAPDGKRFLIPGQPGANTCLRWQLYERAK